MFLFYQIFKVFNTPARIPSQTLPAREIQNEFPPNFKNISLGFANPSPRKLLRKTESVFAFPHSASFEKYCGGVWSVSRTSALAEALCFAQRRFSARGTLGRIFHTFLLKWVRASFNRDSWIKKKYKKE